MGVCNRMDRVEGEDAEEEEEDQHHQSIYEPGASGGSNVDEGLVAFSGPGGEWDGSAGVAAAGIPGLKNGFVSSCESSLLN